jgi:hypothetical protein
MLCVCVCVCACVCVCLSVPILTYETTDLFSETWYEKHAIGEHQNAVIFNFLQSTTAKWLTREIPSLLWRNRKVL